MSSAAPLSAIEMKAKMHAILCATGFLILLPIGVLVARYTRTFTNRWIDAHWLIQLIISGPVIFTGWAFGHQTVDTLRQPHFMDTHQKCGLALLILYVIQLMIGMFIHYVKFPSLFRGRRPPQNYFHVLVGVSIFILAQYQVHYGLYIEWNFFFGNIHPVPQSAKHAWLALMIIFWVLYATGLAVFLPRQIKQEKHSVRKSENPPEEESRTE